MKFGTSRIKHPEKTYESGQKAIEALPKNGLSHTMVFSEGLKLNGSELVKGLHEALPKGVAATGGLAADGGQFKKTLVGLNRPPEEGKVVAIGFYGKKLKVGYGSMGGWNPFGPDRMITRSHANIVYELDGQPALDLYKRYLGKQSRGLPQTGLLFPLNLQRLTDKGKIEVIRTLLSVNEKDRSITFAGDMPEGSYVQMMKANVDQLILGADEAAKICRKEMRNAKPDLAILISCFGRKLVLKERAEEEISRVRAKLGRNTKITGFYSYGEISPVKPFEPKCSLHNQTMTITTFRE